MKARLLLTLLLLASVPRMGWSQSTLNFPKFFSAAELPNSGFAIVNPGSTNASVTFTLYGANGSVVATGTQSYGPGTQLARSGDQVFNNQLGTGGWIQATSSVTGLQGFWLNYDGALTYLDGAEAATSAINQVVPLVAGSTDINIANPNTTATTVSIELRGIDGSQLVPAVSQNIPANGVFHSDAFTLFSVIDPTIKSNARYVRIVSGSSSSLAATAVVKNYLVPVEDAVVNGVDESSLATQLNVPHVVSGPLGGPNYTTVLGVTNLTGTAQTVTITFYNCGNPTFGSTVSVPACTPSTPVQIQLAGRGSMSDTVQHLFNVPSGTFVDGWIQVTGTQPLAGFAAYADLAGGAFTIVPAKATGSTNLMFAHIANLPPWNTGIAVLNPTTTPANVKVYAMTPAGTLIGGASTDPATATLTIAPGGKTALGLSQLIPEAGVQSASHPTDGGFVFIQSTNNVPVFAIELFYNNSVTILSNVASGSLASGITYNAPTPAQPLTISSVSPTSVARGSTLTIAGTGFSTSASSVIFTTASGTVSVTATGTSTSLTVTVPPTAISGPVQVQSGGQTTNSTTTIIDVLASSNSLVQSTIAVSAGQTVSGTDIYVPTTTASTALNATLVGVADVGATQVFFGTSSVEVLHGATKLLIVAGTGITAANGSTVSISGSGITISGQPTFAALGDGTPYVLVTINIAAGATLGPRNVVVTNSNLQTSVVTGGLFIR